MDNISIVKLLLLRVICICSKEQVYIWIVVVVVTMANRVSATSTEHANIAKGESRKETDDAKQSPKIDSCRPGSDECTDSSKVSAKQNMEGNGDGKLSKPSKDATSGKGGGGAKSQENEVFIPAPPPATNAWTKRMQASCMASKPAAESAFADERHTTARSQADSSKPTAGRKPSPSHTPSDPSTKSDEQSSRLRPDDSVQVESTSSANVTGSKPPPVEPTETPSSSSKQPAEAQPKCGGAASSKGDVLVKSTSAVSDTSPVSGGCWKIPVTAAHLPPVDDSPAEKQHFTDQSAGKSVGSLVVSSIALCRLKLLFHVHCVF